MSDLQAFHVGLNDVYDFAYNIAQEFEKIVLSCDIDTLKPVIDKVISVLEVLESSIKRIEQLEAEVRNLKSNNLYLYSEKIASDQEKYKLKQIYEESEESWLEEVMNVKSQLTTLKSENELLKSHLTEEEGICSKSDDKLGDTIQGQSEVINKLKHTVKEKEKQLQDAVSTISASEEELVPSKSSEYSFEEALTEDFSCCQHQEMTTEEKIKKLQSELQSLRDKSKQHQTNVSKLSPRENKGPLSTIHQLFHLFLGVTALSEFCWF